MEEQNILLNLILKPAKASKFSNLFLNHINIKYIIYICTNQEKKKKVIALNDSF